MLFLCPFLRALLTYIHDIPRPLQGLLPYVPEQSGVRTNLTLKSQNGCFQWYSMCHVCVVAARAPLEMCIPFNSSIYHPSVSMGLQKDGFQSSEALNSVETSCLVEILCLHVYVRIQLSRSNCFECSLESHIICIVKECLGPLSLRLLLNTLRN